jgi:hypothetical protein
MTTIQIIEFQGYSLTEKSFKSLQKEANFISKKMKYTKENQIKMLDILRKLAKKWHEIDPPTYYGKTIEAKKSSLRYDKQ